MNLEIPGYKYMYICCYWTALSANVEEKPKLSSKRSLNFSLVKPPVDGSIEVDKNKTKCFTIQVDEFCSSLAYLSKV